MVDLNSLQGDISLADNKGKVSICSESGLATPCGNFDAKKGITLCLTDTNSETPTSQVVNGTLDFSNEIVRMKYPKFEWGKNVEILFLCDETAGNGIPRIISEEKSTKVEIEWWTAAACPPIPVQARDYFFRDKFLRYKMLLEILNFMRFSDKKRLNAKKKEIL